MEQVDFCRPQTPATPRKGTSKLLWVGLVVLIGGAAPLIAICIAASLGLTSDPNPNPVGPGLLLFFTFWPGVIMTAIGAINTYKSRVATR